LPVCYASEYQKNLAAGSPGFQGFMSFSGLSQWKFRMNPDLEFSAPYPTQQVGTPRYQLFPAGHVMRQRWPCQEERALLVENLGVDRGDRPTGLAE
jgi:hypothetical protein